MESFDISIRNNRFVSNGVETLRTFRFSIGLPCPTGGSHRLPSIQKVGTRSCSRAASIARIASTRPAPLASVRSTDLGLNRALADQASFSVCAFDRCRAASTFARILVDPFLSELSSDRIARSAGVELEARERDDRRGSRSAQSQI